MLLTFGFDLMVIHSHTVIISASDNHSVIKREIAANAYKMAGDLLRLTTACLQHSHTFMACVCLYLSAEFLNTPVMLLLLMTHTFHTHPLSNYYPIPQPLRPH